MSFGSNGATRQDKQQTQTTRATQILPASRSLTGNLQGFWNKIIQIVYIEIFTAKYEFWQKYELEFYALTVTL